MNEHQNVRQELHHQIEAILGQHGNGIRAGLWLGGAMGAPWFSRNADSIFPTASSIKSFVLVELFSKYRDNLDAPLVGLDAILDDDRHPASAHFPTQGQEEIRQELREASARYLAEALMGKTEVSNLVYNAASNLAIALLGGPQAVTQAIHERDPVFDSVRLNRYMLTDRTQNGDNTLAPVALAHLYQCLASKQLNGIDDATLLAMQEVLFVAQDQDVELGRLYFKDGLLASRPVTIVFAGWWDTLRGPLVFVIMTADTYAPEGEEAITVLSQTATELSEVLISAGQNVLKCQGKRP